MKKKRPFIVAFLVLVCFALIALLNTSSTNTTGFTVYNKLSSIFSGNALSTMGTPMILMTIVLGISIVGLRKITKD